ncbi:hypothetical protein [Motiliproteus sediminis]|uniref:hypothetical protein n=1 Tax=Motiliproteus sediminis TaxID=1468178 RepID=UPI001AF020E8|nr:hypothetical protein [Motiliproteus sediminis]
MDVSQALAPAMATIETARMRENVTAKLLKESLEMQGEQLLQLIPPVPQVDPSSAIGQNIDLYV